MAFSRWYNNYFYTYHKSNSKNNSKLIEQIFAVAPNPDDNDGEYVEFTIQYGSLKKENKRKEFVEKCIQCADEDTHFYLRDDLNLLIDEFMKACEEDEDEDNYKYRK